MLSFQLDVQCQGVDQEEEQANDLHRTVIEKLLAVKHAEAQLCRAEGRVNVVRLGVVGSCTLLLDSSKWVVPFASVRLTSSAVWFVSSTVYPISMMS
jgi:hypothetical protein